MNCKHFKWSIELRKHVCTKELPEHLIVLSEATEELECIQISCPNHPEYVMEISPVEMGWNL